MVISRLLPNSYFFTNFYFYLGKSYSKYNYNFGANAVVLLLPNSKRKKERNFKSQYR